MQRATLPPIIPLPGGSGHQRPTLGMKGAWKLERVGNSKVPAFLSWVVAMSSRRGSLCMGSGLPMSSLYMVPELYMVPLLSWTVPPNGLCPGSSVCWNAVLHRAIQYWLLCLIQASAQMSPPLRDRLYSLPTTVYPLTQLHLFLQHLSLPGILSPITLFCIMCFPH